MWYRPLDPNRYVSYVLREAPRSRDKRVRRRVNRITLPTQVLPTPVRYFEFSQSRQASRISCKVITRCGTTMAPSYSHTEVQVIPRNSRKVFGITRAPRPHTRLAFLFRRRAEARALRYAAVARSGFRVIRFSADYTDCRLETASGENATAIHLNHAKAPRAVRVKLRAIRAVQMIL